MHVSNYPQVRKNTVCTGIIRLSSLSYTCFTTKPHYCGERLILEGAVHALSICTVHYIKNFHYRDINRGNKLEFSYRK